MALGRRTVSLFVLTGAALACVGLVIPVAAQDLSVRPEASHRLPGAVTALAVTDEHLLAGDARGHAAVWALDGTGAVLQVDADDRVLFVGTTSGDSAFVVVDAGGAVSVRGLPDGEPLASYRTEAQPVRVALDAGRRYLAVGNEKERIELFDLRAGRRTGTIDAREMGGDLVFLGFDRLGRQLIAVTKEADVLSWNPVTLQALRRLTLQGGSIHGSRSKIHAAAANRSANVLVVGLEEVALPKGGVGRRARPGDLVRRDLVVAYDWESGIELRRIEVPSGPVALLALGPGSDYAAVADAENRTVRFINLRDGAPEAAVTVEGEPEVFLVSEDGLRLVVGTREGHVSSWDLALTEAVTPEDALPTLAGRIRVVGEAAPALTPERPVVLAVLPFDDRIASEDVTHLVAEALTTRLANVEHLTLVERLRIDAILAEFDLLERGLTEADGLRVGRLLNADYVLLGSVGSFGPNYLFNARVLEVETGEVVSGRQVVCEECRRQDLFDAIGVLSGTIAQNK
jgi:TolB-like protein